MFTYNLQYLLFLLCTLMLCLLTFSFVIVWDLAYNIYPPIEKSYS